MAMKYKVRVGQIWRSCDLRCRWQPGRQELEVISVGEKYCKLYNPKTRRTTRVRLDRMKPTSTGFSYVKDGDPDADVGELI